MKCKEITPEVVESLKFKDIENGSLFVFLPFQYPRSPDVPSVKLGSSAWTYLNIPCLSQDGAVGEFRVRVINGYFQETEL